MHDFSEAASLKNLAIVLFDIGKSLLLKKDFFGSVTWLDRAMVHLQQHSQDQTPPETEKELLISVIHSLAIASLGIQTPEANKRAHELLEKLKSLTSFSDRRTQLIRLELFASPLSEAFDANGYADVLHQMIKTFDSSVAEFQLLHHHIHKLHSKSPGLGCSILDEFMLALRHGDSSVEWIEKLIITRVWLLAHQRETAEELDAAKSIFSKLRIPISAETAAAAQTASTLLHCQADSN